MKYRTLGRTGEKVSIIGLGGAHIGFQRDENESIRLIRAAVDGGVNFLDNSWDYNGGASEIRMGKALRDGYRKDVFLMTKIDGQTRKAAMEQLDESLRRLQTHGVDLIQFHEVIRMTDPERIFAPGGALEAMLDAKKAGKTRFIGFTGHKNPDVHLKMLQTAREHGFLFDTVQMPLNVMDAHFDSFEKKVLPVLLESKIAVLGMKPIGGGNILRSNVVTARECLRYAMSLPVDVTITGCYTMDNIEQALDVAEHFTPMSVEERKELLARTAAEARDGRHELYKTDTVFDATARNPQWLG